MKLESQVCSLELAKRLKELGVKQESLFYHECFNDDVCTIKYITHRIYDEGILTHYSAFTVAELGIMLPPFIEKDGKTYWCHFNIMFIEYMTRDGNYDDLGHIQRGETEADVRAKMLIYLIENGLIKNDNPNTQI